MKIYLLKGIQAKLLAAGVAVVTLSCMIVAGIFQQGVMTSSSEGTYVPIYSVETQEKKVAITLNAAQENTHVDAIMKILDQYQVKATFFVTGDWVDHFSEDVKKLFDAGQEIQNYSNCSPHPNQLSREQLVEDTYACDQKIKAITGIFPNLYRTPYNEYNDQTLSTLNSLGKKTILGDVDLTTSNLSAQELYENNIGKVTNGSILLFDIDNAETPQALELTLSQLNEQGYQFVFVNDLMIQGRFRINSNGRMIAAE